MANSVQATDRSVLSGIGRRRNCHNRIVCWSADATLRTAARPKEAIVPVSSLKLQADRDKAGRFAKGKSGNPKGKPPGARNAATRLAEAMLDGEAAALTRKIMERALVGDPTAMRLCFERIVAPRRERTVEIDLPPIRNAGDIAGAMGAIAAAVANGAVTPSDAGELARMVATLLRAIEVSDFDRRLGLLEKALALRS
jgi:hypothetical protein